MANRRWDPFRDVFSLQSSMNSLLQEYARQGGGRAEGDTLTAGAFVPPVDIYEDQDTVVLTLEVPGVAEDAFDITVEHNTLFVRGERRWQNEQKEENYHRVERRYGSFSRSFTLPQTVDTQNVQASYEAGVLRIELTKRAETKSRQVKVQLGGRKTPSEALGGRKTPSEALGGNSQNTPQQALSGSHKATTEAVAQDTKAASPSPSSPTSADERVLAGAGAR